MDNNVYYFHFDLFNDFSDHAPIVLKLYTSETIYAVPCVSSSDKISITIDKVARNNECLEYMREKVTCCSIDIDQVISNIEVDDRSSIDDAVNDITEIINDATCECRKFITVTNTQRYINVTDDKPWFNQECRNLHSIL